MTTIFNSGGKDGNVESYFSDARRILSDMQYNISVTRRSFITPTANKLVKNLAEGLSTSSKLLFGEDFPARTTPAKEVEELSQKLEKPSA